MNKPSHYWCLRTGREAFSLPELLVMIAVLAFWICLVAPVLAKTKNHSRDFVCLNNLRQLMAANLMYTQDHRELFPPNPDDGNTVPGHNWCAGQGGIGGSSEFNAGILKNPLLCVLVPYLRTNANVFRCTGDLRQGRSTEAGSIANIVPAARSISMNHAVGTICPGYDVYSGHSGVPALPVNGPWLTGTHGGNYSRTGLWRTYGKTSAMVAPVPSELWVITEENPWSINDSTFAMSIGAPKWIDYPSIAHNTGCCLAFGDGHSELHKWLDQSIILTNRPSGFPTVPEGDRDWSWLAARTSTRLQ